jgi:SAM-dependent methyltransferase
MADLNSLAEFNALLDQIGNGVPNTDQYQRMAGLVLDFPEAHKLGRLDPYSTEYKAAAMELYLSLRGRAEQGYVAARDEAPAGEIPENVWTGLIPWSFRDARMVSEHVLAWGHILGHLSLPDRGALLEYGPGSGQLLLMAARMGYRACGVDIDAIALEGIRAQASHLNLSVETECAEFGHGFGDQTFDTIVFYEAFHHAFDFDELLVVLHDRLKPSGRIVLCGEPVVTDVTDGIPYPWGPRLDALSVFCMRRFGWMELGFTHDYLMKITRLKGWVPSFYPFPNCGRAAVYVLEQKPGVAPPDDCMLKQIRSLQLELAGLRASTSWRITNPLRASKRLFDQLRTAMVHD